MKDSSFDGDWTPNRDWKECWNVSYVPSAFYKKKSIHLQKKNNFSEIWHIYHPTAGYKLFCVPNSEGFAWWNTKCWKKCVACYTLSGSLPWPHLISPSDNSQFVFQRAHHSGWDSAWMGPCLCSLSHCLSGVSVSHHLLTEPHASQLPAEPLFSLHFSNWWWY